jgi:CheY-like chemotaxis protein
MAKKNRDPLNLKVNWRYRNILIVDDVTENYELTRKALETTKAKILHAQSGLEAIRMCIENKRVDLVLMEANLPGISGSEAASRIKELRPDVVVIGQSALISSATHEQQQEPGFDDFFVKPVPPNEMIAFIRACLVKSEKRV